MQSNRAFIVGLGDRRYRVDRPWPRLAPGRELGFVSQLALDSHGRVYLLNRGDPIVTVLDHDGIVVDEWRDKPASDGHGIYVASDDRVFLVDRDGHRVLVFNTAGALLQTIGDADRPGFGLPFNHPTDVAVASSGDIYVSDGYGNSHVHRFSKDGRLVQSWGGPGTAPGRFTTPHAVWVDRQSRVLVADRENNRVQIFDLEGRYLAEIGDLYRPMDIAEGGDGTIYVTDQTPRLSAFSPDGRLIGRCRTFGTYGHGIAVDNIGNLFVAEMQPTNVTRLRLL
jgi:NHL repeat